MEHTTTLTNEQIDFGVLFSEVIKWQKETFPGATAKSKAHHLKEEIDELLDALNGGDELETVKEFADCFTLLIGIAGAKGWTAQKVLEVVAAKQEINKARKWGKPDENGVVKHIKT